MDTGCFHMDIRNRRRLFYAFNIIVPLAMGFFFYIRFRHDSYISEAVGRFIVLPEGPGLLPQRMISFIVDFGSDILWAYSLAFSVMAVLSYSRSALRTAFVTCVSLGILTEVLQKADVFHGTFDLWDIVFEVLSVIMALIIIKLFEEARYEKNSSRT